MENYENKPENGKQIFWIVGGVIVVLMIIGLVYSATQKSMDNDLDDGDTVMLDDKGMPIVSGDVKGAVAMVSVPATITGMDVVNLQSFPQRVQARIKATLPDGCSTLDTPTVTQDGKKFTVTVTGSHPADAVCTQVVTNQETVIDLPVSGLAAGTYTVALGTITKTFTLKADNQVQYSSDK